MPRTHLSFLGLLLTGLAATTSSAQATRQVLWDVTHGVTSGYDPSGQFSTLDSAAAAAGYTISTTSAGVDNIDLSPYDMLVICLGSSYLSAYTGSEVTAVVDFVNAGGGLLVLGDNSTSRPENINPITTAFGTTTGLSNVTPMDLYLTSFSAHPMFAGTNKIYFRAAGQMSASSPSQVELQAASGEPVVNSNTTNKVVIVGDINIFDNTRIVDHDNQEFALNIFHYLTHGLVLNASPPAVNVGDTLTFTTRGGGANQPALLTIVDVDQIPLFLKVNLGLFDGNGENVLSGTVAAGLSGLSVGFQTFGIDAQGKIQSSNRDVDLFL